VKRFALAGAVLALAVPATANAQDPAPVTKKDAKQACKAERAAGGKQAFKVKYGANGYGKCVKAWRAEGAEAKSNAAKECKAERAADAEAFAATYGTGKNGKNAYGKCVSSKAKAKFEEAVEAEVEATENAAQACKAERRADKDAFRQQYGTNKNKRNAFGKCVAAKKAEQAESGEGSETETETP